MAEIKKTRYEQLHHLKVLDICVKSLALGGISSIVCATVNEGRVEKVKMAQLK